mmetsp:Transcript_169403/g.411846  ORF Transcript_169403/g.411846 Transcript_169403/m.411846 type:complete len:624 (-) Transcript_169403:50-1921(-)
MRQIVQGRGRGVLRLATEVIPELVVLVALSEDSDLQGALDGVRNAGSGRLLLVVAALALPHSHAGVRAQHEAVARVEAGRRRVHLHAARVARAASLDVVQAVRVGGSSLGRSAGIGAVELASHTTGVDDHLALEQVAEVARLLALRHADLARLARQLLGEFRGEEGARALLVDGGLATLPEVDDGLLRAALVVVLVQDNVAVAAEELAVQLLLERSASKVHDLPDGQLARAVVDLLCRVRRKLLVQLGNIHLTDLDLVTRSARNPRALIHLREVNRGDSLPLAEECLHVSGLGVLDDARHRRPRWALLGGQVVLGRLHAVLLLVASGSLADPHPDGAAVVNDEHIVGVQHLALQVAALTSNLRHLERAAGVADLEELHCGSVLSLVVATLIRRLDVIDGAAERTPELGVVGLIGDHDGLRTSAALVADAREHLHAARLLVAVGLCARPQEQLEAGIEDEHITVVHGRGSQLDLLDAHIAAALDLQQARGVLVAHDMVETGVDATLEVLDAAVLEVRQEQGRLVVLALAMLRGATSKRVVQLHRLVRGDTGLVLAGLLAEPEVQVPLLGARRRGLGVQHDVAVTRVELAVELRGDWRGHQFLDAPDLQAIRLAGSRELGHVVCW